MLDFCRIKHCVYILSLEYHSLANQGPFHHNMGEQEQSQQFSDLCETHYTLGRWLQEDVMGQSPLGYSLWEVWTCACGGFGGLDCLGS